MASQKSAISVAMIYIPVSLQKSTRETDVSFKQLCKDENNKFSRIKYQKICPNCNKEVSSKDIIKGYEYDKGKYVTISNDELERIKTKKDKTIHVIHFAKMSEIDSILFDRNYYLVPEPGGEKAFELFRQALLTLKRVAVAKTVMGTKEELLILYPTKNGIVSKILFYQNELVSPPSFYKVQVDKKEIDMAKVLIESMTEKFDLRKYEDEYQEKLKQAIQEKIDGQEIVSVADDIVPNNMVDLMTALQQSIELTKNKASDMPS